MLAFVFLILTFFYLLSNLISPYKSEKSEREIKTKTSREVMIKKERKMSNCNELHILRTFFLKQYTPFLYSYSDGNQISFFILSKKNYLFLCDIG